MQGAAAKRISDPRQAGVWGSVSCICYSKLPLAPPGHKPSRDSGHNEPNAPSSPFGFHPSSIAVPLSASNLRAQSVLGYTFQVLSSVS